MSKPVKVEYRVMVSVDPDAWALNYGPIEEEVPNDVATVVRQVIEEAVATWLERTGNEGTVTVS